MQFYFKEYARWWTSSIITSYCTKKYLWQGFAGLVKIRTNQTDLEGIILFSLKGWFEIGPPPTFHVRMKQSLILLMLYATMRIIAILMPWSAAQIHTPLDSARARKWIRARMQRRRPLHLQRINRTMISTPRRERTHPVEEMELRMNTQPLRGWFREMPMRGQILRHFLLHTFPQSPAKTGKDGDSDDTYMDDDSTTVENARTKGIVFSHGCTGLNAIVHA